MSVRTSESYSSFVRLQGERVRLALIAVFGPDTGAEATSEALAYGWQHWERVSVMENPTGYLYAVGRNWARRHARRRSELPAALPTERGSDVWVEPGLPAALEALSGKQRSAVILVHGYGWTLEEATAVLGVGRSTVQKHVNRGLARLRRSLGVSDVG